MSITNPTSATPQPLELRPVSLAHYHTSQVSDLVDLLERRGWRRMRPRRRATTLQLARGMSVIMMTPSGCVNAKGPGAVVALHLATEQGGQS